MDDKSFNIRVPKKWARGAAIVVATALIVAPLTAWASHAFDDVPSSHTFHDDITWLASSGVTKGCNPPANTDFCPDDFVTRGQMAAFIHRLANNQVVDAATALEAGNADKLDGIDSSGFVQAGTFPDTSLNVTGSSLRPRQNDVTWDSNPSGGCLFVTAGDEFTIFNTPVHLPDGATVQSLRIHYIDNSGSNGSSWFTVYDQAGSIVDEWLAATAGNSGAGFADSGAIDHVVDNETYSYLLNFRPTVTNDIQLCGFQLFYGGHTIGSEGAETGGGNNGGSGE